MTGERQGRISDILAEDGRVVASDLAALFRVSEDTVRRDLRELAARGLCRRVYGGALPAAPDEGSLQQRRGAAVERKAALAQVVTRMILPDSVLFVDAGSTNLAVAAALPGDAGLTVVTNAPAIAGVLAERGGFEIILVGGRLDADSGGCLGPQALRDLERFRFSALILGACGVDAEAGLTAHRFEEAELKAAAAARSAGILVAATNEKLGTAAAYSIVPAGRMTHLVVEADRPERQAARLRALGIPVSVAEPVAASPSLRRPRRAGGRPS